jgi:hypothetical protein
MTIFPGAVYGEDSIMMISKTNEDNEEMIIAKNYAIVGALNCFCSSKGRSDKGIMSWLHCFSELYDSSNDEK